MRARHVRGVRVGTLVYGILWLGAVGASAQTASGIPAGRDLQGAGISEVRFRSSVRKDWRGRPR